MDQKLPKHLLQKQRLKRIFSILAVIMLVIVSVIGFRQLLSPSISRNRIITSIAVRGSLEVTISASGIIVPKYEQTITSPVQTNILAVYHKAGEKISKGGQIMKLNKEFLQISYSKLKDELELKKVQKIKQLIILENKDAEAGADYSIRELNVKFNEAKSRRQEGLFKIGAATIESIEESKLNLMISEKEKEKLKKEMVNRIKLQQAEMDELDLQIRICENNLNEIKRQLELADVIADKDGIIIWVNENIGANINAGEKIATIADLSSFQVEATISDLHAAELYSGERVKVKLNQSLLIGEISAVNPSISNGSITFHVNLAESSNPILRPQQRVEVYVVTSFKDNVIKIKNGPFYNGSINQPVFVVYNDKALSRTVVFGESNFDYVEVKKGISPGEEVIISDMSKYQNINELNIN